MKPAKIYGYGEDALTLWALREQLSVILNEFQDKTSQSECLVFYRPSFGRHSKVNSSVFGEFDSIIVSKCKIYLIESKWDNLADFKNVELLLREEQTLRHKIFSWYLNHWNQKYRGNWDSFVENHQIDFQKEFKGHRKTMAFSSLLAENLEYILNKCLERCETISSENIKNILLFFHSLKSNPPTETSKNFTIIPITYPSGINGNFVDLLGEA